MSNETPTIETSTDTTSESTTEVAQNTTIPTGTNEPVTSNVGANSTVPEGTNGQADIPITEEEFELKVNGQSLKYKKEEVLTAAQKFYAGEDKFRESSLQQKQLVETLKTKPWEVMAQLGLDPDKLAHDRLYEKIRRERMTPEQRELEDLRTKQKTWEEREQETVKQQEETQRLQVVESNKNAIAQSILEELPKATDFPQDSSSVVKILGKMKEALNFGHKISVNQAIELLRKDREDTAKWLSQADPAVVAKIMGQETLNKLSKTQIDQVRSQAADNRAKGLKQTPKTEAPEEKKQTMRDWVAERERARYAK